MISSGVWSWILFNAKTLYNLTENTHDLSKKRAGWFVSIFLQSQTEQYYVTKKPQMSGFSQIRQWNEVQKQMLHMVSDSVAL